jgi:hypothetical protein
VSRRKLLSQLDDFDESAAAGEDVTTQVEKRHVTDETDVNAVLDPVMRLNTAFKTMQIVGQILKNFTGSINGELKTKMAAECYRLGLRSLAAILQLMRNHEEAVIAAVFDILKREHPRSKDDDLFERAKSAVYDLAQIVAYGIVRRIALAVGSERLSLTYANVLRGDDTNAVWLVDIALKLDHASSVPENDLFRAQRRYAKNPLADSLLRQLVVHHFYLFDVHYIVKQRVCEKLQIPYERMVAADRREKLIVKAPNAPALLTAVSTPKPAEPKA